MNSILACASADASVRNSPTKRSRKKSGFPLPDELSSRTWTPDFSEYPSMSEQRAAEGTERQSDVTSTRDWLEFSLTVSSDVWEAGGIVLSVSA